MSNNPEKRIRQQVNARRYIRTYAVLNAAGYHAIEDGKTRFKGSFFEWMTANLFAAFSVEAYLNDLGQKRFHCWSYLERLPIESKLALLLEDLNENPDFSRRPFSTLKEMFRFRNALAHGRSEHVEESSEQKLLLDEPPRYPQADWENRCDQQTATRFREDAKAIMWQLHTWAGLDTRYMFSTGLSSSESSPIRERRSKKRTKQKRS